MGLWYTVSVLREIGMPKSSLKEYANMAIDTHNVVHSTELVDILRASIEGVLGDETLSEKLPATMIWGPPGVGKSTIVKTLARDMSVGFVDVRLAQMESIDIRGIPVPNKETKTVDWFPSSIFPKDNSKGGIIFLDELSAAPKDVQVAAYELILDRQLGGGEVYKVPSKWIVVAAGNRSCDRAVASTMSSALANRMLHLEVEANAEDWAAWAVSHGVHPSVIGFINFKPSLLLSIDDQNLERGFPTPRSWERVSEMVKILKNETLLRKAVYGLVGTAAGQQFMEFHKMASQMDNVLEMMTNPKVPVKVPNRDDLKFALTSAMVYHLWRGKDKADTASRVEGFLRISMELPPAFATQAMTSARLGTETVKPAEAVMTIMRHPNYKGWRTKFGNNLNDNYEV